MNYAAPAKGANAALVSPSKAFQGGAGFFDCYLKQQVKYHPTRQGPK